MDAPGRRSIPQELCDRIIDELKDDKETLRSCTLVSPAWVFSARRYFFTSIACRARTGFGDLLQFLRDAPLSVVLNLRILIMTSGRLHLRDLAAVLNRFPSLSHLYLRKITIEQTHEALITASFPVSCRVHALELSRTRLDPLILHLMLLYIHPSELTIAPSCKRASSWDANVMLPAPFQADQPSHDDLAALSAGLDIQKADIHDIELVARTMQRLPVPPSFEAVVLRRLDAEAAAHAKTILQSCGPKLTSLKLYTITSGNEGRIGRLLGLDDCPHIEHFALNTADLYPATDLVETALAELFKNRGHTSRVDFQLTCPELTFGTPRGAGALDKVLRHYVPYRIRTVTLQLQHIATGYGGEDRRHEYFLVIRLPSKDRQDAMRAMMPQVTRSGVLRFST